MRNTIMSGAKNAVSSGGVLASLAVVMYGMYCRVVPYLKYGETINEYDPWFNYRCSKYIRENGIVAYTKWVDEKTWIPKGRSIVDTAYPVYFLCSNMVHKAMDLVWMFSVTHYQVCCCMPVVYFVVCLVLVYRMCGVVYARDTKRNKRVKKMVAVCMFSVSGGIFEKTMCGAYDYEGLSLVMVLALVLVHMHWNNKSVKSKSSVENNVESSTKSSGGTKNASSSNRVDRTGVMSSVITPQNTRYMAYAVCIGVLQSVFAATWGGSVYTELVFVIDACVRMRDGKFLLLHTGITLALTCMMPWCRAVGVPLVGKVLVGTAVEAYVLVRKSKHKYCIAGGVVAAGACVVLPGVVYYGMERAVKMGVHVLHNTKIYNVLVRQNTHPLVVSVSEHSAPSARMILDMCGVYVYGLPLMVPYVIHKAYKRSMQDTHMVYIVGTVVAACMYVYMERFAFLVSPFVSIMAADVTVDILTWETTSSVDVSKSEGADGSNNNNSTRSGDGSSRSKILSNILKTSLKVYTTVALAVYVVNSMMMCMKLTDNVMIVMKGYNTKNKVVVLDDYREAAMYIKYNTPDDAVIISWWDYGYQITGMTDRHTVIDNNTNDYTRISEVAEMMIQPEAQITNEHKLIKQIRETVSKHIYVYVVCGHVSKYVMCDVSKLFWMIHIAKENNASISPRDYYFASGNIASLLFQDLVLLDPVSYTMNNKPVHISKALHDSLIFRLSYFEYAKDVSLRNFELFYQSKNHIVRIYKMIEA